MHQYWLKSFFLKQHAYIINFHNHLDIVKTVDSLLIVFSLLSLIVVSSNLYEIYMFYILSMCYPLLLNYIYMDFIKIHLVHGIRRG